MRDSLCLSTMKKHASRGALLLNLTQPVFEHRQLLQLSWRREEENYYVNYIPPARDAITLPRNVVYVLVGVVLVMVATYAIVGHLIKDLMHDIADWILGPKSMEDDLDEDRAETAEEWRLSVSSSLMETDRQEMEMEKDQQLPGLHWGDASHSLFASPPLRKTISPALSEENSLSSESVTCACPSTTYVTSL